MAGQMLHVNSGEVVLVAATAKSLLQIKAAANVRVCIRAIRLLGKQPAGGNDTPVKIRGTRSVANFGTFTAVTPSKDNPSNGETVQTAAGQNATVEPTTPSDSGHLWELPPQLMAGELLPLTQPIQIPGGQSFQFEATSIATPTIAIEVDIEE